jgi:transposase
VAETLEELLKIKAQQAARIASLETENERQAQEIKLLKEKIDLLVRRIFGSKSEKLDPQQLELLLSQTGINLGKEEASAEELSAEASSLAAILEAVKEKPKQTGHKKRRERWPEDLPIETQIIEPDEVKAQPENYRLIGEELSEQLDYRPAQFFRRQTIRRKYVSRKETDLPPVIAPLPATLQERCVAAPGLLAQLLVSKYVDHLPLYRQEQILLNRHDIYLPRQSLSRWVGLASEWLKPIYEQIKAELFCLNYVQVDETPIKYLDPGNGKTSQGYLWVAHQPGGDVFYHWETSRAARCLENVIPVDFKGILQCDGYAAYESFARQRNELQSGEAILLAGCWAHMRRGFFDALEQFPSQAGFILIHIRNLYVLERRMRLQGFGPTLRDYYRANTSQPIIQRIYKALEQWKLQGKFLPQSTMAKAIHYALEHRQRLEFYLDAPMVEIDNNLVENAIRPTALGKKNFLFFGEAHAGERSAIIYTIVESCRRRGVEPYTYLHDVLTRLPSMTNWQIKDITPKAWAQAHRKLSKAA